MPNPRIFDIAEANAATPRLVPILRKIREKQRRMQTQHDQLLVLDLMNSGEQMDYQSRSGREYLDRSHELETLILSLEDDIIAIHRLGGVLKDIDQGLVDFYHVRKKELVYLCWRLGEEKISFWHDLDSCFEDRIPI